MSRNATLALLAEAAVSANSAIFEHPAYPIIAGGQLRLMEAGIGGKRAWDISRQCLIEHMADEKIKVGDPRFAWDAESGRQIVEEYYLDHAEQSALNREGGK